MFPQRVADEDIEVSITLDISKCRPGDGVPANICYSEGHVSTLSFKGWIVGAWSCGVAKEKSLAVVLANEKIEVAVPSISAKLGWRSCRYPQSRGLVSTISGVSRSSRRTGVAEEFGCAVSIADEEIEVAIVIEIRQGGLAPRPTSVIPKGLFPPSRV